jgi:hypothetical protein
VVRATLRSLDEKAARKDRPGAPLEREKNLRTVWFLVKPRIEPVFEGRLSAIAATERGRSAWRLLTGRDGGFLPQILQPSPQRQSEGQTAQHSRDHGGSPEHRVGRISGSQSVQQVRHQAGGDLGSHGP